MKRRLASLILSAVLLCGLFAGCTPAPAPGGNGTTPGGSSSGSSSGSETDDNNGGGHSAVKIQPTVKLEGFNAPYISSKKGYVASYIFSITNPNQNYSLSNARISITLADDAGTMQTDYTTIQMVAPNDTIRFAYSRTYTNWRPTHVVSCRIDSSFQTPETESDGTPKLAQSNDVTIKSSTLHKSSKFDYDSIEGIAHNNSRYPCAVKVSLLLTQNGKMVYATWVNSTSAVPAIGDFAFTIFVPKDISYDHYELIAIPFQ